MSKAISTECDSCGSISRHWKDVLNAKVGDKWKQDCPTELCICISATVRKVFHE